MMMVTLWIARTGTKNFKKQLPMHKLNEIKKLLETNTLAKVVSDLKYEFSETESKDRKKEIVSLMQEIKVMIDILNIKDKDYCLVEGILNQKTEKAIKLGTQWYPLFVVQYEEPSYFVVGKKIEIMVAEWFLVEKLLI